MIRMLLLVSLLPLTSCATARIIPAHAGMAPEPLELAESDASIAITQIGAYTADPLSRFEGPEIAAVQRDIVTLREESVEAAFVKEATILEQDWETLVGLDEVLQQESAI